MRIREDSKTFAPESQKLILNLVAYFLGSFLSAVFVDTEITLFLYITRILKLCFVFITVKFYHFITSTLS